MKAAQLARRSKKIKINGRARLRRTPVHKEYERPAHDAFKDATALTSVIYGGHSDQGAGFGVLARRDNDARSEAHDRAREGVGGPTATRKLDPGSP
jgi:hypothetical protein